MSNATDAADYIKRMAAVYQGFVETAAQLDRIGSVENAAAEAQAAAQTAFASRDKALSDLAQAQAQVVDAQDKANVLLADANKAAIEQSDAIIANAQAQAKTLVDAGQAQYDAMQVSGKSFLAAMDEKINEKNVEYDNLLKKLADTNAQLTAAQADFDRLTQAVIDLKSKFA